MAKMQLPKGQAGLAAPDGAQTATDNGERRSASIRRNGPEDTAFVSNSICDMMWALLPEDRRQSALREQVIEAVSRDVTALLSRPDTQVLIAESEGGERVGLLVMGERQHLFTGEREGFVHYVFVVPAWRRTGLATDLLKAADSIAASRGYTHLNLETVVHNTSMRSLAELLGYEPEYLGYRKRLGRG